jgi:anti-sigma regulatory factor (Ser/Thr protein kinase)
VLAVQALALDRETLEMELLADATTLSTLRRRLRDWLRQAGADEDEIYDIVLAACEAGANAIEHAYGPRQAYFAMAARIVEDEVILDVSDRGTWRRQRQRRRGRGLGVMRETMDDVEVTQGEEGTNVRLRRRLGRRDGRAGSHRDR